MRSFLNHLATQLPTVIAQLPAHVRRLIPRAELDVAATLAANAVDNASCAAAAAARAGRDAWSASATTNDADGANIHPGVTCDRSGMCPIVGPRYNLVGHNYDLCEAEFNKLNEREKALYQKVPPPFVHNYDLCEAEFNKLNEREKALYQKVP